MEYQKLELHCILLNIRTTYELLGVKKLLSGLIRNIMFNSINNIE